MGRGPRLCCVAPRLRLRGKGPPIQFQKRVVVRDLGGHEVKVSSMRRCKRIGVLRQLLAYKKRVFMSRVLLCKPDGLAFDDCQEIEDDMDITMYISGNTELEPHRDEVLTWAWWVFWHHITEDDRWEFANTSREWMPSSHTLPFRRLLSEILNVDMSVFVWSNDNIDDVLNDAIHVVMNEEYWNMPHGGASLGMLSP
jgi:hypothetical protein